MRERIIDDFDRAWQSEVPPRIEDFLPTAPAAAKTTDEPTRRILLEELVPIDLERRWRRAGQGNAILQDRQANQPGNPVPLRPRLEDYLGRFPELGAPDQLSLELIGEEYRVRQVWGDRPSHAEYARRFANQGLKVHEWLSRIDVELAVELAGKNGPRPAKEMPKAGGLRIGEGGKMVQPITSVASLLDTLRQSKLLSPEQLGDLLRGDFAGRFVDPRHLGKELLQRDWLTPYQVNQLMAGRSQELVLGAYLLLERLGQGGTGDVFKARHLTMNRLAAIKVIRKDLLDDPEALGRFLREIHVSSQLTGPHVVRAYDSGPIGSSYYLAMEYVQGIDLARLVKQIGALPAGQACDYIRQAALGLQHLHEKGLVHRDIKPSNLMVAGLPDPAKGLTPPSGCVVKILDLGLARLHRSVDEMTRDLTGNNAVLMGTLDYMAPEQAQDFHGADIRSDLYSLGCTFYYLLAGQPPFPGGTIPQKIVSHMQAEPAPLEQFRRDVPEHLTVVLRKMMAKQPQQRFQTPAEVARALDTSVPARAGSLALPVPATRPLPLAAAVRLPVAPSGEVVVISASSAQRGKPVQSLRNWLQHRPPRQRRRIVWAIGIAALVVVGCLGWFLAGGPSRKPEAQSSSGKAEEIFLSDLSETKVDLHTGRKLGKNGMIPGWGNGREEGISIRGKVSPKGLCAVPPGPGTARVSYQLSKRFRQLKGSVGLPDTHPECPTPLTFAVIGDGRVLWQSSPVTKQADEQEFAVRVSGVDVLELAVTCPGTGKNRNGSFVTFPVWIDPRLIK